MANPGVSVEDESSKLHTVIVGIADSPGPPRDINKRAEEALKNGTYPDERRLTTCVEAFVRELTSAGVDVLRPTNSPDLNQIFTRDIGFVVGEVFVKGRMKEAVRAGEYSLIEQHVRAATNVVITPPDSVVVEGGDVVLCRDTIFVGVGRRTNHNAVAFLRETFPSRTVVGCELLHDGQDAHDSVLHLDCVFGPIGSDSALIFPAGFRKVPDQLYDLFPNDKRIALTADDLYNLSCNIFSIAPDHIISCDTFRSLNEQLRERAFTVSTVPYSDVGILGGLLRCSTLPLRRETTR
jgi:N-dimethylarginine dimethylaminohydrolase